MIKVNCHTNLDLANAEEWPTELPSVPRVGDLIQSKHRWNNKFQLTLKVVRVYWKYVRGYSKDQDRYEPFIELNTDFDMTTREFYEWYTPLIGESVSSFI